MALAFGDLDWIAVIAAAVAGAVLGFIWYLPQVFGRRWATAGGRDLPSFREVRPVVMIAAVLVPLVMAYVLALLMKGLGAGSLVNGLIVGFLAWLGFSATTSINTVMYEERSWEYWLINAGYALVSLLAMGAIIGYLGP